MTPPELSSPTAQPRVSLKIEEFLAALALGLVALITFANVLIRYFSDLSFAFTEEVSVCLMVIMTFLGASVAVVRNHHMRISFLADRLPALWQRRASIFSLLMIHVMFLILAVSGALFAYDDFRFEVTSPALGLPQWIYTLWLPLLSLVVAGRAAGAALRLLRGPTP